jgi:uncharacterized protein (TIGR02145 family)
MISIKLSTGRHFTWYVVMDTRKICPSCWHLLGEDEMVKIFTYIWAIHKGDLPACRQAGLNRGFSSVG